MKMKNKYINKFLISISCCAFIIIACFSLNFYVTKKSYTSDSDFILNSDIKSIFKKNLNGLTASDVAEVTLDNLNNLKSLSVEENNITMNLDQTYQLKYNIDPLGYDISKLNWTSSNNDVISVNQGIITANSLGTAIITVSAPNGLSTSINVKVEENLSNNGIKFSDSTINLYVDAFYKSSLIGIEDSQLQNVYYESSNSEVATVDNYGKITAISIGKAVINANYNGLQTSMNVVVKKLSSKNNSSGNYSVIFDNNGATEISESKFVCSQSQDGCNIVLPSIVRDGYEILGWSTNKNSIIPEYLVGDIVNVKTQMSFYAITRKKVTAHFFANGSNVLTDELSCNIYNYSKECNIIAPAFYKEGFELIGWSKNKDDQNADINIASEFSINNDSNFYAITKKHVTVYFNPNKSAVRDDSLSCDIYNEKKSCKINTPEIIRDGYDIIGYSPDKKSLIASVDVGQEIDVKNNKIFYAISTKTYTAKFIRNGTDGVDTELKCTVTSDDEKCNIVTPLITRSGFEIKGWTTNLSSDSSYVTGGNSTSINDDTDFYAASSKKVTVTIDPLKSNVSLTTLSCTINNLDKNCSVTLPEIVRAGFAIDGYENQSNVGELVKPNTKINISSNQKYNAITHKKVTATFMSNGLSLSSSSASCVIGSNEDKCTITTPNINIDSTYDKGFNLDNNNGITYSANSNVQISEDTKFYAVTSKTINILFDANGATSLESTSKSCKLINNSSTCQIKVPTITRNGFEIKGFSTNPNDTNASITEGQDIDVSSSTKYYAITSKTINITFNGNGLNLDNTSGSCVIRNNNSSCTIKTPSVINSDGYNIKGFAKTSSSQDATINQNTNTNFSDSGTYYLVYGRTYTAYFNGNGASLSKTSDSCTVYNSNGSCTIKTPVITADNVVGFSTNKNTQTATIEQNKDLTLSSSNSGTTYYAISYKKNTATFNNERSFVNNGIETRECNAYNENTSCTVITPEYNINGYNNLGWSYQKDYNNGNISIAAQPGAALSINGNKVLYNIYSIKDDGIINGCTGWVIEDTYYYSDTNNSNPSYLNAGSSFTIVEETSDYLKVILPITGQPYGYIDKYKVAINLPDYIPSITYDIKNAYSSIYVSSSIPLRDVPNAANITGENLYGAFTPTVFNKRLMKNEFLVPSLYIFAKDLKQAQEEFIRQGYSIIVYDSYRPKHVSADINDTLEKLANINGTVSNGLNTNGWNQSWFIASGVSRHNTASAVDISIRSLNGSTVVMPTAMHELSVNAVKCSGPMSPSSSRCTSYASTMTTDAKKLDSIMLSIDGIEGLASEWWHFQLNSNDYNTYVSSNLRNNGANFDVSSSSIHSY